EVEPEEAGRDGHDADEGAEDRDHTEETDESAPAAEAIRQPAHQQRTDDPGELVDEDAEAAALERRALVVLEIRRAPVEHAVARDVDEHVRDREEPDVLVL